jgi:hypothetical protein
MKISKANPQAEHLLRGIGQISDETLAIADDYTDESRGKHMIPSWRLYAPLAAACLITVISALVLFRGGGITEPTEPTEPTCATEAAGYEYVERPRIYNDDSIYLTSGEIIEGIRINNRDGRLNEVRYYPTFLQTSPESVGERLVFNEFAGANIHPVPKKFEAYKSDYDSSIPINMLDIAVYRIAGLPQELAVAVQIGDSDEYWTFAESFNMKTSAHYLTLLENLHTNPALALDKVLVLAKGFRQLPFGEPNRTSPMLNPVFTNDRRRWESAVSRFLCRGFRRDDFDAVMSLLSGIDFSAAMDSEYNPSYYEVVIEFAFIDTGMRERIEIYRDFVLFRGLRFSVERAELENFFAYLDSKGITYGRADEDESAPPAPNPYSAVYNAYKTGEILAEFDKHFIPESVRIVRSKSGGFSHLLDRGWYSDTFAEDYRAVWSLISGIDFSNPLDLQAVAGLNENLTLLHTVISVRFSFPEFEVWSFGRIDINGKYVSVYSDYFNETHQFLICNDKLQEFYSEYDICIL